MRAELLRRARQQCDQSFLVVDYYRIRRKVAFPLPVQKIVLPDFPVRDIPAYPWATWMLWALEERLHCLGWAASDAGDHAARELARTEIEALAHWPCYRQYDNPDLSFGHACRVLWTACTNWDWAADLRPAIRAALHRAVDDALPLAEPRYDGLDRVEKVLALESPHWKLANIALIGTCGMALAAHASGHPAVDHLDQRLEALIGALFELQARGFSEGVAYDGYVLDFVVHWLGLLPPERRLQLLGHPSLARMLANSVDLAVPGRAEDVARIGDVEPVEMPFHLSAHAKFLGLRHDPESLWLLQACDPARLRADALAALVACRGDAAAAAPAPRAADCGYALGLRSGWDAHDLCAVVSVSASPMGHLPPDRGTLVVGTGGHWLIDDPGYQQYMRTSEHDFSIGPAAHNAPRINGNAPTIRPSDRDFVLEERPGNVRFASIDLLGAYLPELQLREARRLLWLCGRELVVLADRITGESLDRIDYTWHGHPDAAWWVAGNWAAVHLPDATLWLTSPQTAIHCADVPRLRGSRGHLSLESRMNDPLAPAQWWVFFVSPEPTPAELPSIELTAGGAGLRVGEREFSSS